MIEQSWFEMRDFRRRSVADRVWIPLRASQYFLKRGNYGYDGYQEDFFGLGSVAVAVARKEEAEKLTWMDIGLSHSTGSYASGEFYKTAELYEYSLGDRLGIELILEQSLSQMDYVEWHLNQDIVFALGLTREQDTWVRPMEAYVEVVKLLRDHDGRPCSIEIKAEYLKDYLAARGMALRLSWYRRRIGTAVDATGISWTDGKLIEKRECERFEGRAWSILEGGDLPGSGVAVFHSWRTDVDAEIEIPEFGPENQENSDFKSFYFTRSSEAVLSMIEGEVWRNEWVNPAVLSVRVRGDEVAPIAFFATDNSGARESRVTLQKEDVGKWLWFRPSVISSLLEVRGAMLEWYTAETGSVSIVAGYKVHFGVNPVSYITVYAYDIARLPDWQQAIWAGFNISPEGGVSRELLSAQMHAKPAATVAAEVKFPRALERVDTAFQARWARPLLRKHPDSASIMRTIHRFRAIDRRGLLALAKDVARMTADSFDISSLSYAVPPERDDEKKKSIKSLERVLASFGDPKRARSVTSALVGAYDLRLGDAHLPASTLEDSFSLVGIDRSDTPVVQGEKLLLAVSFSLEQAAEMFESEKEL